MPLSIFLSQSLCVSHRAVLTMMVMLKYAIVNMLMYRINSTRPFMSTFQHFLYFPLRLLFIA